jgi:hypothetical protein
MLKHISRVRLVGAWCAAVIVIGALAVVAGVAITASNGELLLAVCVVPPAVMFFVWRGAPPVTVAELLHAVDEPSPKARP